jgi:hypothetical protein
MLIYSIIFVESLVSYSEELFFRSSCMTSRSMDSTKTNLSLLYISYGGSSPNFFGKLLNNFINIKKSHKK